MRRKLFNLAAAVSLVLCVMLTAAIIVQWVRSSLGGELIARNTIHVKTDRETVINRRFWSTPGTLNFDWREEKTVVPAHTLIASAPKVSWVHKRYDGDHGYLKRDAGDAPDWLVRLGLNWSGERSPPSGTSPKIQSRSVWVQVQYSFLLAAAMAMTLVQAIVLWRVTTRRRRQRLIGMCATCGYDLRATPGKCPECGAVP